MTRIETLVIVYRDDKVLLGMKKKRGEKSFGVGKWNGYGGGLEDGESLDECACRETLDEAGIDLKNLRKAGDNLYKFEGDEQDHLVHVYTTDYFEGYFRDSDEMGNHTWFHKSEIPYDKMWKNDKFWMPYLLDGKKFNAEISMTANGETLSCVINGREHLE